MTRNKHKYPYNRYVNETMGGDKVASDVAKDDMALLRAEVESLKLAVSELKAAIAALQGSSKPAQSPSGSEPVDPNLPAQGSGTMTDVDPNTGAPLGETTVVVPPGQDPTQPPSGATVEGGSSPGSAPAESDSGSSQTASDMETVTLEPGEKLTVESRAAGDKARSARKVR